MHIPTRSVSALCIAVVAATLPPPASAEDAFTLANRAAAQRVDRHGDVPLGGVIRTDERYGADGLFLGPRGWDYWNLLQNPSEDQNPNLWPDKRPTYFLAALAMPAGSSLTIHGKFPHARYFKFAVYKFEHQTFVAEEGGSLSGWDIEPDPGSGNPYRVGADRDVQERAYTIHILAEDPPANVKAPANTVYVGPQGEALTLAVRVYVSDEGYDGAGWGPWDVPSSAGPLWTYEGGLADGTSLSAEEVVKRFARPMGKAPPLMQAEQWYALVSAKGNDPSLSPASAPARPDPQWRLFSGLRPAIQGEFTTPGDLDKIPLQKEMEAGGDPSTAYLYTYLSREFGPVYVFRAKLPTFPDTFSGAKTMPDGQVKYWSVATMASPPSGALWDGVYDMQAALDNQGYYTIVVSRPEDRPKNAIAANGITWIDWGAGEGVDDPRNRADWGMLLMRFMVCHPDWENSPQRITQRGAEAAVMGPYYPRGYYTTKAKFEAEGYRPSAPTAR